MTDLRFGIESGPKALALDMRDQATQFQQAQGFPDRAAAGAETLLQFLLAQGLAWPDRAIHDQRADLFLQKIRNRGGRFDVQSAPLCTARGMV
ncbi:hypothetical protein D3C78_1168270 [compost metagenome]